MINFQRNTLHSGKNGVYRGKFCSFFYFLVKYIEPVRDSSTWRDNKWARKVWIRDDSSRPVRRMLSSLTIFVSHYGNYYVSVRASVLHCQALLWKYYCHFDKHELVTARCYANEKRHNTNVHTNGVALKSRYNWFGFTWQTSRLIWSIIILLPAAEMDINVHRQSRGNYIARATLERHRGEGHAERDELMTAKNSVVENNPTLLYS